MTGGRLNGDEAELQKFPSFFSFPSLVLCKKKC